MGVSQTRSEPERETNVWLTVLALDQACWAWTRRGSADDDSRCGRIAEIRSEQPNADAKKADGAS